MKSYILKGEGKSLPAFQWTGNEDCFPDLLANKVKVTFPHNGKIEDNEIWRLEGGVDLIYNSGKFTKLDIGDYFLTYGSGYISVYKKNTFEGMYKEQDAGN